MVGKNDRHPMSVRRVPLGGDTCPRCSTDHSAIIPFMDCSMYFHIFVPHQFHPVCTWGRGFPSSLMTVCTWGRGVTSSLMINYEHYFFLLFVTQPAFSWKM